MSDEGDRFMILRFSSRDDLKEFYRMFQEAELGSLVKIGSDPDGRNNQRKEKKSTKWSEMGLENLDQKDSEKPSLI